MPDPRAPRRSPHRAGTMAGAPAGRRAGTPAGRGRFGDERSGSTQAPSRLVSAAQILLGLTLSCLLAVLVGFALLAIIGLIFYLAR